MLVIELLKIFKRKFNYIYLTITILFLLSTHLLKNSYFPNVELSREEFLFDYSFKLITIFAIFFVILNIILSYVKDYNEKIAKLIRFSTVARFYNLFSKMITNYIVGCLYYFILLFIYLGVFYRDISIVLSKVMENNLVFSLLLVLFASNLSLLIVASFTSIYFALPLTILLLTSLTFIREFISEQFNIQLGVDIFSYSFSKLSVQLSSLDMSTIIQLLIYTICAFFISLIAKFSKE